MARKIVYTSFVFLVWRQRESGGTGMYYGLTLPLSGIDGDVGRLIEFAHIAEQEGWEGVFLEDYIVYWESRNTPTYDPWLTLQPLPYAHIRSASGSRSHRSRCGVP